MAPAAVVLCIDDDPRILKLFTTILELNGYEVLSATSGLQAFAVLAEHSVDCVVLDYHLPGVSGDLIAAEIRRHRPHIPLLMVSGSLPEVIPAEVDAFMEKIDIHSELLNNIEALLNKNPSDSVKRARADHTRATGMRT